MMMQYAFKMQFKHFHSLGLAKKGGSLNYMNLRAYTILIGYYGQNVSFMPCASRGWDYCVGVCVRVSVCVLCVCVCVCQCVSRCVYEGLFVFVYDIKIFVYVCDCV